MKNETLIRAAEAARGRAYAPYSKYQVGAALLTGEGKIFTGSNIENASYGLTVCAERVAVWNAVHSGLHDFTKIAVVTGDSPPASPCGACRQVLWELAGDVEVIMANPAGDTIIMSLEKMLHMPFGQARWEEENSGSYLLEKDMHWRLPVVVNPIGYVLNSYQTRKDIPSDYKERFASLVLNPDLVEGLYRLEEENKIIVLSHLHLARGYNLKEERSGRGNEVYGVFACRAPMRPNAIAETVVDLLAVDENILSVRGLDLLNGTPVLDIKTDYRSS